MAEPSLSNIQVLLIIGLAIRSQGVDAKDNSGRKKSFCIKFKLGNQFWYNSGSHDEAITEILDDPGLVPLWRGEILAPPTGKYHCRLGHVF